MDGVVIGGRLAGPKRKLSVTITFKSRSMNVWRHYATLFRAQSGLLFGRELLEVVALAARLDQ